MDKEFAVDSNGLHLAVELMCRDFKAVRRIRRVYMDSSRLPTAFLILVEIANVYPAYWRSICSFWP